MKAIIDAGAFSDALKKLSEVPKRSSIETLENIRVDFTGNACILTATDLEVWMTCRLPAQGDAFSFVFKNTIHAARACRYYDGPLELQLSGDAKDLRLLLSCGEKRAEFPVATTELSPELPSVEPKQQYHTNAKVLCQRARRVQYASTKTADKPALVGVRFQDNRMWCTDGHRLAVNRDPTLHVATPFVISTEALRHLRAFGDVQVELNVGERYARITDGTMILQARLLEASTFFDLDRVWNQPPKERYRIDRACFLDGLKYLSEFAGKQKSAAVFHDGQISFCGDGFAYHVTLPVNGECSIPYGFDLQYMREALEQLSGAEQVEMGVISPYSPFTLQNGTGNGALVLPMRIKEEWLRKAA